MIALNMTDEPCALLLANRLGGGCVLLNTHLDRSEEVVAEDLELAPTRV